MYLYLCICIIFEQQIQLKTTIMAALALEPAPRTSRVGCGRNSHNIWCVDVDVRVCVRACGLPPSPHVCKHSMWFVAQNHVLQQCGRQGLQTRMCVCCERIDHLDSRDRAAFMQPICVRSCMLGFMFRYVDAGLLNTTEMVLPNVCAWACVCMSVPPIACARTCGHRAIVGALFWKTRVRSHIVILFVYLSVCAFAESFCQRLRSDHRGLVHQAVRHRRLRRNAWQ